MKTCNVVSCSIFFISIVTILFLSAAPSPLASTDLNVTVFTDKPFYFYEENVTIYGNLTENGNLTVGLVAVEVRNPQGQVYVARTLPTGPNPMVYETISILRVDPCDQFGNPRSSFGKGTLAYFKMWVRNTGEEPQQVRHLVVNVFDANMVSLGVYGFHYLTIPAKWDGDFLISYSIPNEASVGTATVYANAYTEWPSIGGSIFCPEKNASFQITDSVGSGAILTTKTQNPNVDQGTDGTYSLFFRLPFRAKAGDYNVYVSARYHWQQAPTNSKVFKLTLLGDADGDGVVDSTDLGLLGLAWGSTQGQPLYNPNCDFNSDGVVDSTDLGIIGLYWGKGY